MTDVAYLPAGGDGADRPAGQRHRPGRSGSRGPRHRSAGGRADRRVRARPAPGPGLGAAAPWRGPWRSATRCSTAPAPQRGQIRVVPVPAPKQIPPPSPRRSPRPSARATRSHPRRPLRPVPGRHRRSPPSSTPSRSPRCPGRAFSTGEQIRYFAPADAPPGRVTFSYIAVAGSAAPPLQPVQTVSTVTITVTDPDPARNAAPAEPPPVDRTGVRRRLDHHLGAAGPASTRTATG